MKFKIKRKYIHCDLLEEAPMWGNIKPKDHDLYAEKSADLMREPDAFKIACINVLSKWPNSCIQNLSAKCTNRTAWMGQAANYLSHNSVEYTTRIGWRMLDPDEQAEANRIANEVIKLWELQQCQK